MQVGQHSSPAVTLHPISPHRKSAGCSILLGLATLGCAPQLMGLGKGRLSRMGLGMCQASECCTQSMHTSPGHFSQKSYPRCLCCTRITLDPLGRADRQRQAPPKVHPGGSFVTRLPNRVLPTLPSVNGSCSSHSLPVSPSPGRKEEVTSGSHPGRPQEGSLWKGSPAAPCLHLPSELSPGCRGCEHIWTGKGRDALLKSWLLSTGRDSQERAALLGVVRPNPTTGTGTQGTHAPHSEGLDCS